MVQDTRYHSQLSNRTSTTTYWKCNCPQTQFKFKRFFVSTLNFATTSTSNIYQRVPPDTAVSGGQHFVSVGAFSATARYSSHFSDKQNTTALRYHSIYCISLLIMDTNSKCDYHRRHDYCLQTVITPFANHPTNLYRFLSNVREKSLSSGALVIADGQFIRRCNSRTLFRRW